MLVTPSFVADRYGDDVRPTPDAASSDLVRALVAQRTSATGVAEDPRLDAVARDAAALVERGGAASPDVVQFLLYNAGVLAPTEKLAIGSAAADTGHGAVAALSSQLLPALTDNDIRIGAAIVGNTSLALIVRNNAITFAPLKRSWNAAEPITISGKTAEAGILPTVSVKGDSPAAPSVTTDGAGGFHVALKCGERPAILWISISASGSDRSLRFPLYCGMRPPATYTAELARNVDGATTANDAQRRIAALLNRDRRSAGLDEFRSDPLLGRFAQTFVEDHQPTANEQPSKEAVLSSLRRSGILTSQVAWSVFHADSLGAAVEYLENDPELRERLHDRTFTRIGVGVTRGQAGVLIAVVVVRVPDRIDARRLAARVVSEIEKRAPDSSDSDNLSIVAFRYAAQLAQGRPENDVRPQIVSALGDYRVSAINVLRTVEPGGPTIEELTRGNKFSRVGVGVVQSERNGPFFGEIWVVVILTD